MQHVICGAWRRASDLIRLLHGALGAGAGGPVPLYLGQRSQIDQSTCTIGGLMQKVATVYIWQWLRYDISGCFCTLSRLLVYPIIHTFAIQMHRFLPRSIVCWNSLSDTGDAREDARTPETCSVCHTWRLSSPRASMELALELHEHFGALTLVSGINSIQHFCVVVSARAVRHCD